MRHVTTMIDNSHKQEILVFSLKFCIYAGSSREPQHCFPTLQTCRTCAPNNWNIHTLFNACLAASSKMNSDMVKDSKEQFHEAGIDKKML